MKNKLTNYMLKRGLFHLFLLTLAAVFLYPFIWMVVTSVKTGEENLEKDILPDMPAFRAQSPYVREVKTAIMPDECEPEKWTRIKPQMIAEVKSLLLQTRSSPDTQWNLEKKVETYEAAAEYATMKTVNRMPSSIWSEADDAIITQFNTSLSQGAGGTVEVCKRAMNNAQSRMIINGIQVRSKDGKIKLSKRFKPVPTPPFQIEGAGKLQYDSDDKLVVCSDFTDTAEPIILTYKFKVDTAPEDLHRIALEVIYDDTWHQIDTQIDLNGITYTGSRTKWAGENKADAITLQFPDDEVEVDWGKRPWVKLDGPIPKNQGKEISNLILTIKITPSGTSTARYGKIKRNYERIFLSMPFWSYVWNSIVLTVLMVLGAVFSSCFVAYAFARLQWPGKSIAFIILLSTMMLPPQVTMIPQFLEWRMLGWYNTLNPIWLPTWFGVAFFIFLMVQQMKGIPKDLEEAAEVDGMNRLQIWWYVIVPLVRPGMAAIAIMSFMSAWNEFMAPLIYLRDMDKFPLSVGIYAMGADETMNNDMAFIMAGNLLMTLPVILIFFAFQRYFIQGVASSGVKG